MCKIGVFLILRGSSAKEEKILRSLWRYRLRAGFKDDFEIIEVKIEELPDGTGKSETEETIEILSDENPTQGTRQEPMTKSIRLSTGFALGVLSVGLSVLSLYA